MTLDELIEFWEREVGEIDSYYISIEKQEATLFFLKLLKGQDNGK